MLIHIAGAIIGGKIYYNTHRIGAEIPQPINPEDWFTDYGWFFPTTGESIIRRLTLQNFEIKDTATCRGAVIRPGGNVYEIKYMYNWESRRIAHRRTLPVTLIGLTDEETVLVAAALEALSLRPDLIDKKIDVKFINSVLSNFVTVGKLVPWITTKELDLRLRKMALKELPY